MKILVTGGLGFIGSHLVSRLLKENHEITILDNLNNAQDLKQFDFLDKVKFVKGDVRDRELTAGLVKDQDIVFHLAALSNIRESIRLPEYCFSTNITGTFNILEACQAHNVRRMIFFSSREVYGNSKGKPFKEEDETNPINLYGLTKKVSEEICHHFKKKGINTTIFRISNVYGEGDLVPGRVVPTFIKSCLQDKNLLINGGQQTIDFIYIDDVIDNLVLAIDDYSNSTINLGSGKETTIIELADKIISLSGSVSNKIIQPKINQEVDRYCADISKMKNKPVVALEEGLKRVINFYQNAEE